MITNDGFLFNSVGTEFEAIIVNVCPFNVKFLLDFEFSLNFLRTFVAFT